MKWDHWILFKDLGPLNPTAHIQTEFDVWLGVSYPKWHFYAKSAPVTLEKIFFLFLHWIPLDHI